DVVGPGLMPGALTAAQEEAVGLRLDRALADQATSFVGSQFDLERGDDLLRQLILNGEDVAEIAIESLGPDMAAGGRVDELGGDANAGAVFAHAAFQHVPHAKRPSDLGNGHRLSLEDERG